MGHARDQVARRQDQVHVAARPDRGVVLHGDLTLGVQRKITRGGHVQQVQRRGIDHMHIRTGFDGQIGKVVGRCGKRDVPARLQTGQRAGGFCLNIRASNLHDVASGTA